MKKLLLLLFLIIPKETMHGMNRPHPLNPNEMVILRKALNGRYEDNYFKSKSTQELQQIISLAQDLLNDKNSFNNLDSQIKRITPQEKKNPTFLNKAIDDLIYNANATMEHRKKSPTAQQPITKTLQKTILPQKENSKVCEINAELAALKTRTDKIMAEKRELEKNLRQARNRARNIEQFSQTMQGIYPVFVETIFTAAADGRIDFVKKMIKQGIDINARDEETYGPEKTALMEATTHGQKEVIDFLLANGAKIDVQDDNGRTALYYVWDTDIAKKLIEAGAQVNSRDNQGITPLMNIAQRVEFNSKKTHMRLMPVTIPKPSQKNENILKLLLDEGADINAKDNRNWTAITYALLNEHPQRLKVLLDAGANITLPFDDDPRLLPFIAKPDHEGAILYRKIAAFLKDPLKAIPPRKNTYTSYGYWMLGWNYVDQEALQYLIWAISYNKYEAYLQLKKMYPELFKNVGILVKLFLHAARMGNGEVLIDLKGLLKQKHFNAMSVYYLKAVELIMRYHPEKSPLAHQLMAEDIIMKKIAK